MFWHTLCVPLAVELGGVCELRQDMGQQTKELLREMEHLKSELTGEFCLCMNQGLDEVFNCI